MEWNLLKEMKCPKCSARIADANWGYQCSVAECTFKIGYEKFRDVVNNMYMKRKTKFYKPMHMTEESSRDALNNL